MSISLRTCVAAMLLCTAGACLAAGGPSIRCDFNGDGRSDLLWRNASSGAVYLMPMNGAAVQPGSVIYTEPNPAWQIAAVADFDGDGKADLLWWNSSTGQVYQMLMNGAATRSAAMIYTEPNTAWKIVGSGDFDGDGKADLLWRNSSTGEVYLMPMNGATVLPGKVIYTEPNPAWQIAALGDFDGDGRTDILWWNSATGQVYQMLMNGFSIRSAAMIYSEPDTTWKIVGAGDFDGNGKDDLLWRNAVSGAVYLMPMNGAAVLPGSVIYTESNPAWQIAAIGDYDGDGKADLIWWNSATGQVYQMLMNGAAPRSSAMIYTEPNTAWSLLGGGVRPPATVPGTFTATGSLTAPRVGHTATLLPSGKVLIAGGGTTNGETYDPATGAFTATGAVTSVNGATATLLGNGQVLFTGGAYGTSAMATAGIYDPASSQFHPVGSMSYIRVNHTATLLPNGKVLIAGGTGGNQYYPQRAELYDPGTGLFTLTGSLLEGRSAHTATLLANGKVLLAGGQGGSPLASAELYDPATGVFSRTGAMASMRSGHSATLLAGGKLLVAGGVGNGYLASAELYDPGTGAFTFTGPMAVARSAHGAALLPDGRVLVAGGNGVGVVPCMASAEVYNPATATFSATGALPEAHSGATATLLATGMVLFAGGPGITYDMASRASLYTPETPSTVVPAAFYNPSVYALEVGAAISPISPSASGAATWSITPALPAGLSCDPQTGVITGTPTAPSAATAYLVTAGNGARGSSTWLWLAVSAASVHLDLSIAQVEFNQSIQTPGNGVPIVAGRGGRVRIFALANLPNAFMPDIQVTLANNGIPVAGYPKTLQATAAGVPTVVDESNTTGSMDLLIPAGDLKAPLGTGYSVEAVINPNGQVPEANRANNTFKASFTSVTVPTFRSTLFPVVLASGTASIPESNKGAWVARLARMFPIADTDVIVGPAFTGSVSTLLGDGTGWNSLLLDLATKHLADAASNRYYYGAVKVSYASGTSGMGYVPSVPAASFQYRSAIGWDKASGYADGGEYPEVFAHETGHNMGLSHAPCGNPASPDPNFPYAGGSIGVWGYDSYYNQFLSPTVYKDIMGYCTPNWVSDYNYNKIINFRSGISGFGLPGAGDDPLPPAPSDLRECLIVRGVVHADGQYEFRPGFRTRALPSPANEAGSLRLEGVDASGRKLFTATVDPVASGCLESQKESHFVLALPLDAPALDALAGIRVLAADRILASRAGVSAAARASAAIPEARRWTADQVELRWDAGIHPGLMVRDADTGEVLAILDGGHEFIQSRATRLELVFSDGVAGPTRILDVAP